MSDSFKLKPSKLKLEDGHTFFGFSPSWQEDAYYGEVVFNTGMTGYPDSLTDPSYAGQILTFTYPLIGNYGIPDKTFWESIRIHANGVVVSTAAEKWSHHQGMRSLFEWLHDQRVPIISGVDTRALTKVLREKGTMLGAISSADIEHFSFTNPNQEHLVAKVSSKLKKTFNDDEEKVIIAIDCGMKENIVRSLKKLKAAVHVVPHDYDFTNDRYDAVFISNGPGNPEQCVETIEILKKALLKDKPIFGICLGNQLLALAAGAKTYKLPFGHRGQNQPCIDTETKACFITSQNHGYAIDETSLPDDWKVTFKNLNDNTVSGIAHKTKPFFSVQFHPEAAPGPTDTMWMFDTFYKMIGRCK